jgi:hypothetical protein
MTHAVHLLCCTPVLGRDEGTHQGRNPQDDVFCRSRARFLVDTLQAGGWQLAPTASETIPEGAQCQP